MAYLPWETESDQYYGPNIDIDTTTNKINDKLKTLEANKQAKLVGLAGADISNYSNVNYTGPQVKHDKDIIASGVHDFTNQREILGSLFRDAAVYDSVFAPGKKVTLSSPEGEMGPIRREDMIETEVPKNKYGQYDTRNAYFKQFGLDTPETDDDINKFGLARNDLNDEAIARGMTPESARYSDQTKFWPYKGSRFDPKTGKDNAYDGTPGNMVDESKAKVTFDQEFLNQPITEYELNRYMDRGTIDARVASGSGKEFDKAYKALGGGGTEYTVADKDQLTNRNVGKFEGTLDENVMTPTVPKGYNTRGEYIVDSVNKAAKKYNIDLDGDMGELVDQAQSQALKLYADSSNALRKVSRSIASGLGMSDENVDKYLPINGKLIGFDANVQDIRDDQALRDTLTGFSPESRREWSVMQKEILNNAKNKEFGKMAVNIITSIPQFLADSAPETAAMFLPGGAPAVIGTRLSNQMEDFKKNNKRDMTVGEAFETALTIGATVYAEKILVKSGVSGVIERGASKTGRAGNVAIATIGEGLQEGSENLQESLYTGDVNKRHDLDTAIGIATSPESIVSIAAGGATGGALSGAGNIAGAAYDKGKDIVDKKTKYGQEDTTTSVNNSTSSGATNTVEESRSKANADLESIFNKLEAKEAITSNDITRLSEIEEFMSELKDVPKENRASIKELITTAKNTYASQVINDIDEAEYVLKSKDDLLNMMSDVYDDNIADTSSIDEKMYTLASKAGIVKDKEEFLKIKKDFYAVEKEATVGKKGYITLGKELKSLFEAVTPDAKQIVAKVKKLQKFQTSQEEYIKKANQILAQAETMAKDYNSSLGTKNILPKPTSIKEKINKVGDTFTVNFTENNDGTFSVNRAGIDTFLNSKMENVKGIKKVLDENASKIKEHVGLDAVDMVDSEVVVNTSGTSARLKKALDKVQATISKHKVNRVITVEEKHRNDYVNKIVEVNEGAVNTTEYTSDDVVLLTIPLDTPIVELRKDLSKGGRLNKMINAARKAGAKIQLDIGRSGYTDSKGKKVPENMLRTLVRSALVQYGDKDTIYSPLEYGSDTFMPKAKVEGIRKTVKEENEAKAEKEKAITEEESKALTAFLNGDKIEDIYNSSKLLKEAYKDSDVSTGADKLKKRLLGISKKQMVELLKEKIKESILKKSTAAKDKAELADVEDVIKEMESKLHKKVVALANAEMGRREGIKGVITEIKKIKEQDLDEDAEVNAIEELVLEMVKDVTIDVLNQPSTSRTFTTNGVKVPIQLKSYVSVKNKNSILQIVPVDMMFDETLGIEKNSLDYVKDIVDFIAKTQVISEADVVTEKTATNVRDAEFHDSPALGLVLNEDGGVNRQVAMAMKLALSEYIAFNMSMVDGEYKSKEDVAQMLGVLDGQVGPATYKLLKNKGVFNKTAAPKVGKAVMTKLGLGFNKADGVEKELFDKLTADIGNMALLYGKSTGVIVDEVVPTKEYNKARSNDTGSKVVANEETESQIHFIRLASRTKKGDLNEKVKTLVDEYKVIHTELDEEAEFRRGPSTKPIKVSKSRHVKEQIAKDITGTMIPKGKKQGLKSPKEYMESLVNMEWKVDEKALTRLMNLEEGVMKQYLGYATEESLDNMTFEGRASAVSKNREIDKSIEELKTLQENVKASKGDVYSLYFDWFYSSNGRYMMESNTLNPQTDKLHRFIIQPAEHRSTYTIKDGRVFEGKQDVTEEMNYALAQAFGYAVDKKPTKSIMEIAEKIKSVGYEKLNEAVTKGEPIVLDDGVELEVEHLSHALQALDVIEALEKGEEFTSSITAEYDAVTSGFGLKLMQLPILKDIWKWLNKVGVFKKGQGNKDSMNDVLSETGFYDSYQELASSVKVDASSLKNVDNKGMAIWKSVVNTLPKKIGEEVSKDLRTLFKDPFMTFNYAAGIRSIKTSLANKLSTQVLEGIVQGKEQYNETAELLAKYTGMSVKDLIETLKTKPVESIRINTRAGNFITVDGKKKFNIKDVLDSMMENTFGTQVEEIMTKEFGKFIEINNIVNSSFRVVFDAFKIRYDEEKAKYPVGTLSEEAFMEIMNKLRKEFPVIKGPLSESIEDGITIYNLGSQNVDAESARYTPAQTKTGSSKKGEQTLKIRHMIKNFEAAISSGAVVPIHYIDGALMAQISDVTAIHDAIMPKLGKSKGKIKSYNKAMFDVNSQYSLLSEILDMVNRVDVSGVKKETNVKIKNKEGDYEYTSLPISKAIDQIKADLEAKVSEVQAAKEAVYAEIGMIGHMAGMPGSMWENTADNTGLEKERTKDEKGTIPNIKYVQDRIVPWVELTEDMITGINKIQDVKTLDALIEAINCKGNS